MKSKHVDHIKTEEGNKNDDYELRVKYTKVKETFLDYNDPINNIKMPDAEASIDETSSIETDLSDDSDATDRKEIEKKLKKIKQNGSDSESGSSQSGSQNKNKKNNQSLNLPYLINDLGCTDFRIRRDPKLLDQFLLLKAVIDGSLPKLLFMDIKIF